MRPLDAPILVVDDEPDILELVRFHLEEGGFSVITAASGSESHPVDATARTKALAVGGAALRSALDRDFRRYLYEDEE